MNNNYARFLNTIFYYLGVIVCLMGIWLATDMRRPTRFILIVFLIVAAVMAFGLAVIKLNTMVTFLLALIAVCICAVVMGMSLNDLQETVLVHERAADTVVDSVVTATYADVVVVRGDVVTVEYLEPISVGVTYGVGTPAS